MPRYAASTEVNADKSKLEIERTLSRYGASSFLYGWDEDAAVIGFRMKERMIRFRLPMPSRDADEFLFTPARMYERTKKQQQDAYDQATRQRWRALLLVIKAKLEAVDAGITSFENEFLAATLLPSGETVGEWAVDKIDEAYRSGAMPALLAGVTPRKMLRAGS